MSRTKSDFIAMKIDALIVARVNLAMLQLSPTKNAVEAEFRLAVERAYVELKKGAQP